MKTVKKNMDASTLQETQRRDVIAQCAIEIFIKYPDKYLEINDKR